MMNCPICGKNHEVELKERKAITIIKGLKVEYDEKYYICPDSEGDNEFTTGSMENENLLNARNAYRKQKGLLTSYEIVEIRERYGLSQVDLSQVLGWGEATISRYESKAIQDAPYDNILRLIKNNPLVLYYFYIRNKENFNKNKEAVFLERINEELSKHGRENIARNKLESFYLNYMEPSITNGFQVLNIDKLELVINYLAKHVKYLYKVKLMKMLWYTDILFYQKNKKSLTGLVYQHANMGALPIGHDAILQLDNVVFEEELAEDYDNVRYHIMYNEKIDLKTLSNDEKRIIDSVITKFDTMKTKDVVDYMHEEEAYKKTKDGEIIDYNWADLIQF